MNRTIVYCLTLIRPVLAGAMAVVIALWCRDETLATGWAVVLIALAAAEEASDMLDGYVARRLGTVSRLGGILDPLADSLSRLTIYFAFAMAGWIALAVPLVMAGRDIIVAYCRIARATVGDCTSARFSGKVKAVIQGGGVFVIVSLAWLAGQGYEALVGTLRIVGAAIVIAVTLWSLVDYVRSAIPALRKMKDAA